MGKFLIGACLGILALILLCCCCCVMSYAAILSSPEGREQYCVELEKQGVPKSQDPFNICNK